MSAANVGRVGGGDFSADEAALVSLNVRAARSVLRTVILALEAIDDGSISFDDNAGTERWNPALGEVCVRLRTVRHVFGESVSAPAVDWFTPLTLAEALDAALWRGAGGRQVDGLQSAEVMSAAQVVIDSLDALMEQLEAASVPQAA